MLRIIFGKAKSGKTYQVYSEIAKAMQTNKKTILIVPEQFTLEAEKQLIGQLQSEGFIGLEIVSFKRLAHKVVNATDEVTLSDIGKQMLLRKLFFENQSQLSVYRKAFTKLGFIEKFSETIKELKQNRVSPLLLEGYIKDMPRNNMTAHKLSDIASIYSALESYKENQYSDEEDLFERFIEAIPSSDLISNSLIWLDGFDSFTLQELSVIKAMAEPAEEVSVTLCSDGKLTTALFDHTNLSFQRLTKNESGRFKLEGLNREIPNSDIMHIAENLQAYPYQVKAIDADVACIFASDHQLGEVTYCGSKILDLVREHDYNWNDIILITNNLSAYSGYIKRTFKEMGIPFFIDEKVGVSNHPLVQLIKTYIKLFSVGLNKETVLALVKTGFIDSNPLNIAEFEIFVLENGFSRQKLNQLLEEDHIKLNPLVKALDQIHYEKLRHGKIGVRVAIEAIYQMLVDLKVPVLLENYVTTFNDSGLSNEAQLFSQIWENTMSLFDQLVELIGEDIVTWEELHQLLESGFDAMEIGLLPLTEEAVLIGSMDRSRSHPVKVLFFLGFNDGVIPEQGGANQLILDSEKEWLKENGLQLLSDSKMFVDKEQFNIYFALSRPTERIYFSYAKTDAEGAALRPSYLIHKLKKICPNIIERDVSAHDDQVSYLITSEQASFEHLAGHIRGYVDGYPLSSEWIALLEWYTNNAVENAKLIEAGLTHNNQTARLSEDAVNLIYEFPLKTSVSKLEQFVQCPFKYFVSAGLKPVVHKKFEIAAPDVGVLFHSALERFGREVYLEKINWRDMTRQDVQVKVDEIIEDMTGNDLFYSKFQYRYLISKLKRVTNKAAWQLTRQLQMGSFDPIAFEVAFGEGPNKVPPIMIKLNNGEKVYIQGVIDRVDAFEIEGTRYIKIIDYKSGKKSLSLSEVYHGLQMQLMVYLKACLDHPEYFKVEEIQPAGAFYFKIDDPMIETTDKLLEQIENKIASALKMDGISLENATVLKGIDNALFENGASDVIQVKVKADGDYTKDSKVMPLVAFDGMLQHVTSVIEGIGEELYAGNIAISPCKYDQFVSCQICEYQSICQFDTKFKGNQYRHLKRYSTEEIVERFKG
ncbi:MAG: hypothetical protein BGO41_08500 [Clostridiales bacterium 38-18]|nr:MAG: hypothetical protein BGO41_08500 [Clostridiales bacterium 38-18]